MTSALGLCILVRSVQVPHSCSKSPILDLYQVLLQLGLARTPKIVLALPQCLDSEIKFLLELYIQSFYPSLAHSYDS